MNIRILITLLFGVTLFCSCQPKQLPVNSVAEHHQQLSVVEKEKK